MPDWQSDTKASWSFLFMANEKSTSEFKSPIKTQWKAEKEMKDRGRRELAVSRAKGMKEKVQLWCDDGGERGEVEDRCHARSVTGSGSTEVCCPSARQWSGEHWCPPRCCPETRRVQICPLSASVTRCGRFLQGQQHDDRLKPVNLTRHELLRFKIWNLKIQEKLFAICAGKAVTCLDKTRKHLLQAALRSRRRKQKRNGLWRYLLPKRLAWKLQ